MADNASITILRNTQANVNAEPIKDGNILFTTDQDNNAIYADVGTKRIKIGGTVPIDSTITANSVNPVTSKAIYNKFQDAERHLQNEIAELSASMDDALDALKQDMAKGSLAIVSGLLINNSGDHLIVGNSGETLAVNQTIKFNFA